MKKNKKNLISLIVGASTGSITTLTAAAHMAIYDKIFSRYERPDYSINPGIRQYHQLEKLLKRETIRYASNDVELVGYFYKANKPKGLLITCHGIHSGADDYLPIQEFFVKNNYNVFSFNYQGTYDSGGESTVGMCQSLIDLDNTIKFIKSNDRFNKLPLFLLGHSWGGYAVGSSLCLHKDIKGCAIISGMNNGYNIVMQKAKQYAGNLTYSSKPFINIYQKILFGDYINYDCLTGINESDTHVLIAHGAEDKVILIDKHSTLAYFDKINNPNVQVYIGKGIQSGHDSILKSKDANIYELEIKSELKLLELKKGKKISLEEKRDFYSKVNNELFSKVNTDLLNQILIMFNKTLY